MTNDLTGLRTALYCRVSQDPDREAKSTTDQEREGRAWVHQNGAKLVDVFKDDDLSASQYATKPRPEFERLIATIEAGKLDGGLVWFWEQSRSQRDLEVFVKLRKLCRSHRVRWVIGGRVLDPSDGSDMVLSGIYAVIDENESARTSARVRRGMEGLALAGKPAGRWTYGYRRRYHPVTGKLDHIEPNIFNGNGEAIEDSPAAVVKEIFDRIRAGGSYTQITRDLNDRQVPTPGMLRFEKKWADMGMEGPVVYTGDLRATKTLESRRERPRPPRWTPTSVKTLAANPAYIGRRVHRADWRRPDDVRKSMLEGVEPMWPPLVDEDVFWDVQEIMKERSGKGRGYGPRPATARNLLSYVASCARCGGPLNATNSKPTPGYGYEPRPVYLCLERACTAILRPHLDGYIEEVVIRWLSDEDRWADLTRVGDSTVARQARAEAAELRQQLEQLYRDLEADEVSPSIATRRERTLLPRIADAERRAQESTMPSVLAGRVGKAAQDAWDSASLSVKRQLVRALMEVKVRPVGRGNKVPVEDRVILRPLLGPDADLEEADLAPVPTNQTRALAEIARDGEVRQMDMPQRLGMSVPGVQHLMVRLAKKGWVTRTPLSVSVGKTMMLTLTDAGRQALADAGITDGR